MVVVVAVVFAIRCLVCAHVSNRSKQSSPFSLSTLIHRLPTLQSTPTTHVRLASPVPTSTSQLGAAMLTSSPTATPARTPLAGPTSSALTSSPPSPAAVVPASKRSGLAPTVSIERETTMRDACNDERLLSGPWPTPSTQPRTVSAMPPGTNFWLRRCGEKCSGSGVASAESALLAFRDEGGRRKGLRGRVDVVEGGGRGSGVVGSSE